MTAPLPDAVGVVDFHTNYGPKPKPILERIERLVERDPNSGCWLWSGGTCRGYAYLKVNRQMTLVHRLMAATRHNIEGKLVLHKCDTPACINPDHLFVGTHDDNMKDAARKGRCRGGVNPAPVSPEVAKAIMDETGNPSNYELSRKYGVSRSTVKKIRDRRGKYA